MPGGIGVPELAIILVIIVIIFGVGKLPEIGGALGKGIKEFKTESSSLDDDKKIERGSSEPASSLTAQARERREEVTVSAGDRRERREIRADEI
jgi:sec-independent protein translocase protein TatA